MTDNRPPIPPDLPPRVAEIFEGVWAYVAGHPEPPVSRELQRRHWEYFAAREPLHAVMSEALSVFVAYLARLYLQRTRYATACNVLDDLTRQAVAVIRKAQAGSGGGFTFDNAMRLMGAQQLVSLEVESFYVSAKLLLERIATTFFFFFGRQMPSTGSAHHFLTAGFKKWSSQITGGQKTPKTLHSLMQELDKRVVTFRNVHIEHPKDPHLGLRNDIHYATSSEGVRYHAVQASSSRTSELVFTDYPDDLIALIENYITELLQYFRDHHARSVLHAEGSSSH
jgi:hypothetical protein